VQDVLWNVTMRDDYSELIPKGKRNSYVSRLKKQVSIRLDIQVIEYFKELSDKSGIPYQALINLYLRDCVDNKKEIDLSWRLRMSTDI
jgi:uncharacterized protein (DUF4415 family)